MSVVASSVLLLSVSSSPAMLPLLITHPPAVVVEPESAAAPVDSITSDVQSLRPQEHVQAASSLLLTFMIRSDLLAGRGVSVKPIG